MKIAVMFPGYGSQYVGMGKELYDEYRIVQEYFEEASSCVDINFVKLCFASSDAEISKFLYAYSSLFVIGCSIFALLKEHGITPDVVAGYNNGEFAALCSAGCFSFPDGLYLIQKLASFFEEAVSGLDVDVMHVVGASYEQLFEVCTKIDSAHESLFIAMHNDIHDYVVVGTTDQCKQVRDALEFADGVTIEYLPSDVGLHCVLMNGVVEQLKGYLEKVDFKDTTLPIISGIDGALIAHGESLKQRFVRFLNEPCNFVAVMETLAGYDMIIVVAPAASLSAHLKEAYPDKVIITIEKKSDIEAFKEVVQVDH